VLHSNCCLTFCDGNRQTEQQTRAPVRNTLKTDLAILGGPKAVAGRICADWPVYDDEEYRQLNEVIAGSVWGATGFGPKIAELNRTWASYCGTRRSVALANGTVTMELSLRALGVLPGMEVVVPAWTFMATAVAVLHAGCVPVFVDVDPNNLCIDPTAVEQNISSRTRAIIPVHFAGHPSDMDRIMALARRHDLLIIEDAAQAHGAIWRGRKMGAFGVCGSYSFQQSKNLQCGEGGSVVTDDDDLADRLHFTLSKFGRRQGSSHEPFAHYELGGNANMTEFQAAVALAQFTRLEDQTDHRARNATKLSNWLENIDGIDPLPVDKRVNRHGNHLFVVRYDSAAFSGLCRADFIAAAKAEGVPCFALYPRPLFEEPMYDLERMVVAGTELAIRPTPCPNTRQACADIVAFPQSMLLASSSEIELLPLAIEKIQKQAGQLIRSRRLL